MLKLKNYRNWALYPKMVCICFGVFSLARMLIERAAENQGTHYGVFWAGSAAVAFLFSFLFHWFNKSEELKRVTHAATYRGAYLSVENLYKKVMDSLEEKDTKVFISKEIQYLQDPIKQYIFLKGIFDKLEEHK